MLLLRAKLNAFYLHCLYFTAGGCAMTKLLAVLCLCLLAFAATAQKDESQQQAKIEIDNDQVIVRRYIHPPHSTTPMHSHRSGVVVYLTDVHERSTMADGSTKEVLHKPGDVVWAPARQHILENLGAKPMEVIEIELKDRQ
jgi:quercetin dioxygenase-like cupin family protein